MVFLTIMTTIYTGMNYYVYDNLMMGFGLVEGSKLFLEILFITLGSVFIISRFLQMKFPVYRLSYIGNTWFGIISTALSIFLLKDIILLFLGRKYNPVIFPISLGVIVIAIFWSIYKVSKGPVVKEVKIQSKKLKLDRDLSIVLLSDIHLGMMTSLKWVRSMVQQVNKLSPDVIVITGDLVDDEYKYVERFEALLREFKSKYGVYAIAGNHDHYRGMKEYKTFLGKANIKLLMNQGIEVNDELQLLGLDEGVARYNKPLFKQVLSQSKESHYNVLLSHQPLFFRQAVEMGVDLQLSGHTHKGQILPLSLMINLFYRYAYGLYQYREGHIYTTSGTGTWGPPMRLFSDCEIVKLVIYQ